MRAVIHLEGVRRQLRRALTVRDPNGRKLLFRFYDPQILRLFLPTCSAAELQTFFGPIEALYAFEDEGPSVEVFTLDEQSELVVERRVGPC